jgi:hypothetical protein
LPRFFAAATAYDQLLLDNLVGAHAALIVGANTQRAFLMPDVRASLEKTTETVERVFTDLRALVRSCPTFRALSAGDRPPR